MNDRDFGGNDRDFGVNERGHLEISSKSAIKSAEKLDFYR